MIAVFEDLYAYVHGLHWSDFVRRAARFSPSNLLLLKTAIAATASGVHEMDTLICTLAEAVGIETSLPLAFQRFTKFRPV